MNRSYVLSIVKWIIILTLMFFIFKNYIMPIICHIMTWYFTLSDWKQVILFLSCFPVGFFTYNGYCFWNCANSSDNMEVWTGEGYYPPDEVKKWAFSNFKVAMILTGFNIAVLIFF